MRRAALVLLCGMLGAALLWPAALGRPAQMSSADSQPAEVVVKLTSTAVLSSVAADFGLDPNPIDQFGSRAIYRLQILDGVSPRDKAAALTADPLARVVYAEPNNITEAPEGQGRVLWAGGGGVDDYRSQWADLAIRLPEAHTITSGAGITVAVLDTGVDLTHPALAGRLVGGFDFVDNDSDPSEKGTYGVNPLFGHGTHVAGLVALAAPGARIMPVRVLDPNGRGDEWVLAEALAYAMDPDGDPATDDGANVINLSLSSIEKSKLLKDVIGAVTCGDPAHASPADLPCFLSGGRGAVVVAAAGNRSSSTPEYPAMKVNPFSDVETVKFPPPIGKLEAFCTDGLASLVYTMKGMREMDEKTLRWPGHAEKMNLLLESGFFSTEKLQLEGAEVSPVEMSWKVLETKLGEGPPYDMTVMRVEARAPSGEIVYDMVDKYDRKNDITSMGRTTGFTCSIVTQMVGSGRIRGKGVIPPESAVTSDGVQVLLSELGKRGVKISEKRRSRKK